MRARRQSHRQTWIVAALAALILITHVERATASAAAVVTELNTAFLDVMQRGPVLGFGGRKDVLQPVLQRTFDLDYLAKLALGRDGAGLSSQQHAQFAREFEAMVVATYAGRFNSFSGERFVVVGERALKQGRQLVETLLERPDDSPVRLNYVLQERQGQWRIVNVIAQGVSELSLRRAEFRAVIKRDGFESLLGQIREQTKRQEQGE